MSDYQQGGDSGGNNNSSSSSSGGDDLSGLTGFFFYAFIVHPITAWILRPGRFERRKSIVYAISFLALLAAVKTGLEWQQKGPNYYVQLGITRNAQPLEIKRAYKKLSLQVHPDKNPHNPTQAAADFDALKHAYDVLMDSDLRETYHKLGLEGVKHHKHYDETRFLLEAAIFYVSYGMMAFLLTFGKKCGEARNWTFTGLLAMLVVEVVLITSTNNNSSSSSVIPVWLFPTLTEYEVVWWLHSLFPAFMNGCRSLGAYLFVDLDGQTRQLLLALQEQNKDVLLVLREVQIGVQTIQQHGIHHHNNNYSSANVPSSTRFASDVSSTLLGGGGSSASSSILRATPTGKLKELQDRLQASNATVAQAVSSLKSSSESQGSALSSNMGFYLMILGYIVVSYVFG